MIVHGGFKQKKTSNVRNTMIKTNRGPEMQREGEGEGGTRMGFNQ